MRTQGILIWTTLFLLFIGSLIFNLTVPINYVELTNQSPILPQSVTPTSKPASTPTSKPTSKPASTPTSKPTSKPASTPNQEEAEQQANEEVEQANEQMVKEMEEIP
jgi:cytoskeletal protein RodZ